MRRLDWRILAGVAGGLALAAGFMVWRAGEQRRQVVLESIPAVPDLSMWPAELRQRVDAAEARTRSDPGDPRGLAELGQLYHANGYLGEAALCYEGLVHVDASNARWPHMLASILAGYGRLDEALPLWEETVRMAPDYIPARIRIGDTLLKSNQPAEAAEVYAAALERDPRNRYALIGLARADIAENRWEQARGRLEAAGAQNPMSMGGDLLATVYERLGQNARAEAIRAQGKASGYYSDIPDPWLDELLFDCFDTYRLSLAAGLENFTGTPANAIRLLERAIAIKPDFAPLHYQLGGVRYRLGDLSEARARFQRTVELDPTFPDGWAMLLEIANKVGDRATAERVLEQGLRNCPNSPGLQLARGRRMVELARYDDAVEAFERSIQLRPEEAEARIDLANVHFRMNRISEGVAALEEALRVEPAHPVALTTLALAAISSGDAAGAHVRIEQIRMQPRVDADARRTIETAYREKFGRPPP